MLDKSESEPRISAARARLAKLEDEHRQRIGEAAQEAELRLVIGQLEEFARRVSQGLQEPDWTTRREIVRALVKRVEVDEQEVRIVSRASPPLLKGAPNKVVRNFVGGVMAAFCAVGDTDLSFEQRLVLFVRGQFEGLSHPSVFVGCVRRTNCL